MVKEDEDKLVMGDFIIYDVKGVVSRKTMLYMSDIFQIKKFSYKQKCWKNAGET